MTPFHRAAKKPVVHSIHGHDRPDDYQWLKTQGRADAEVLAYLEGENEHLAAVMAPHRELQAQLYAELLSHVQEDEVEPPILEGEWRYFSRMEPGKPHKIYLREPAAGGEAQELLNLNTLCEREGLANVWVYFTRPSPNGRYLAYLLDKAGQEIWELRILDTQTGELAEAPLTNISGWTLGWNADSTQVYYATEDNTQRPYRIWRHTLGQAQADDELLFQEVDVTFRAGAKVTLNGETLLISSNANTTDEWRAMTTRDPHAQPELILPRRAGVEVSLSDAGTHWLALTNHGGASEFKLVRFPKKPSLTWADAEDVLPYDPAVHLSGLTVFKRHVVLSGRQGGLRRLWVLDRVGDGYSQPRQVTFDETSHAVYLGENRVYDTDTVRILYTSLTRPLEHLDLNLDTLGTTLVQATPVPNYDPALYTTQQVWATAPDGERVPVNLVYRKGTVLPAPTVLNAYGSYGASYDPTFNRKILPLLDLGWVWAIANIRGGSEMGRCWYDSGRLAHKMNTFTDYIAAAETLKAQEIASDLIAVGHSAGGLLMGAIVNLRPDLWKAALVGVPFVDVLSTMLDASIPLTTSEYDEWGNPNNPDAYETMRQYSPYDNLKAVRYPHLFVTTGLNDPRVAYWEPAKYVARIRDLAQEGSGELTLKTNMGAGHGGSSGRYDALNETAEEYAFFITAMEGKL